MYSLNHL